MMYFFSKDGCSKCQYVKEAVDLDELGVIEMDVMTIEGRGLLAWYELVGKSETTLPILVLDDGSHITGAVKIKKYLKKMKEG